MFKWRYNMGVDAQIAGTELERIEKTEGKITPQLVLENSRAETAPLHPCFEWNDSIAAEEYRVYQARKIIQNIIVVDEGRIGQTTRAFVNVETVMPGKKGTFVSVRTAFEDPEKKDIVLQNAMREMRMFRDKYYSLQELSAVITEIDNVLGDDFE